MLNQWLIFLLSFLYSNFLLGSGDFIPNLNDNLLKPYLLSESEKIIGALDAI